MISISIELLLVMHVWFWLFTALPEIELSIMLVLLPISMHLINPSNPLIHIWPIRLQRLILFHLHFLIVILINILTILFMVPRGGPNSLLLLLFQLPLWGWLDIIILGHKVLVMHIVIIMWKKSFIQGGVDWDLVFKCIQLLLWILLILILLHYGAAGLISLGGQRRLVLLAKTRVHVIIFLLIESGGFGVLLLILEIGCGGCCVLGIGSEVCLQLTMLLVFNVIVILGI